MKRIPPQRYEFSTYDITSILSNFRELLEARAFLTMGKYCEAFEKAWAEYSGCHYAAAVSNGTAALQAIFEAIDVRDHDVIVPTNTFGATIFAVIRAGGRPIFADCGWDMTLDFKDVMMRLTPKTKVVVTVHIGGLISPGTYRLMDLCTEKGLYLIEDAAHAQGSTLDKKKAGTLGAAAGFSFFSTKVMTTGEGGMVATNDEQIYREVLLLRDQAKVPGKGNYQEKIGANWRMTEIQALMGLAQLERLDEFIERRNQIARIYDMGLAPMTDLTPLKVHQDSRSNFYKYIVFLSHDIDRDELRQNLKRDYGVSLSGYVYELPCHELPAFKAFRSDSLPVSEELCRRHICLPIYYSLSDNEAEYVIESLIATINSMQR